MENKINEDKHKDNKEKTKSRNNEKEKQENQILAKSNISTIIGDTYYKIAEDLVQSQHNIFLHLCNTKCAPDEPLNKNTIYYILNLISNMDSNNGPSHLGIGEREGRVISSIVHERTYGLVHGIGRSGNINDLQPKACGSSLLVQLTNSMLKNFLHEIGMNFINDIIIIPFATGMTISLCFLTLRQLKPKAKYIIWSRIDQKTCLKCMITAGYEVIVIEPIKLSEENDYELTTNIEGIKESIKKYGKENILCIFSTTSCFAPRGYDNIEEIAKICKEENIYHVVNNAYGIFCSKVCDILSKGNKIGNIDLIISSTDKNFMVPVGGACIYSSNKNMVNLVKKNYAGRASISPILDLFITFLEVGKKQFFSLSKERKEFYKVLVEKMTKVAETFGEKLIPLKNNKISILMTLGNIYKKALEKNNKKCITEIGSMCYLRQISGIRIIANDQPVKEISGYKFNNYGCSSDSYKHLPYLTFACAIGIKKEEVDKFPDKISKIIEDFIENK